MTILVSLSLLASKCYVDAFSLGPTSSLQRFVHQRQQLRKPNMNNIQTKKRTLEMRWGLKGNNPQQKIEGVSDGVNVRDTGEPTIFHCSYSLLPYLISLPPDI